MPDTLYIDTLLKAVQEQREAALNDVCRLRADNALLQQQVAELEDELLCHQNLLAAAKKPTPRAKRPRAKK